MGSKGSNTTTQSYAPNQTVGQSGTTALNMAQSAAGQPFAQPLAPVAPFSDDTLSAFANMRRDQGFAQPYFDRGTQLFNQSAAPITAGQVGNYLNPFADYVMGGLRDVFGQQMKNTTGQLTQAAGGVGADRIGVAQANLAKQQGLVAGQTLSNIYQPALAAAQQDAARQQAAAFGFAQMGPAAQGAQMAGTQGLFNFGGIQQQQRQAELNAPYQLELARLAYPFQTAQFLSGQTAQTAPALGGTTTNTYPKPSPWGTIAGLGMTAAGAFMGNPMMMAGGLSSLGAGQMGGASAGPMGYGGYQTGSTMGLPSGFQYMPAPNGPYSMAPMAWAAGGAVDPMNIGQGYQDGGETFRPQGPWPYIPKEFLPRRADGGDIEFPPPTPYPPEVQSAVDNALATGAPLPESASVLPPPPPPPTAPALPPEFSQLDAEGMPPNALSMAAAPTRAARPIMPAPMAPGPMQPMLDLPPDEGANDFARSPGMALMQAGLATMAAAGKRDSRGLPLPPFAAIGEGGMQGVKTLEVQQQQSLQRRRVDLEARRLLNQAEHQRATLSETKRYHDMLEGSRYDTILERQEDRQERQRQFDLGRTPEQMALAAQTRRLGRPLTDEEITDTITKMRQQSRNPPRPLTPEQQALDARKRELGRDLNPDEIAQVVQRVRQGPPGVAPTGEVTSNIMGEGEVAPNFSGATGGSGVVTNVLNKATGIVGAQAYPAERRATDILNDLAVKTQNTLNGVHGRPTNYWMQRINEITVHPNQWGQGPQAAFNRLVQTRGTIEQEVRRVNEIIENTQTSKADRSKATRSQGELRNLMADYDEVIKAWNLGGDNPLTPIGEGVTSVLPSGGQVRQSAERAKGAMPRNRVEIPPRPQNAPEGARLQQSNRGRYRWVDADGNPLPP